MTLARATNVHQHTAEIHRLVQDILQLHEDVLAQLAITIPESDARTLYDTKVDKQQYRNSHAHSSDIIQGLRDRNIAHKIRRSLDMPWLGRSKNLNMTSEPHEGADVAKTFGRLVSCPGKSNYELTDICTSCR